MNSRKTTLPVKPIDKLTPWLIFWISLLFSSGLSAQQSIWSVESEIKHYNLLAKKNKKIISAHAYIDKLYTASLRHHVMSQIERNIARSNKWFLLIKTRKMTENFHAHLIYSDREYKDTRYLRIQNRYSSHLIRLRTDNLLDEVFTIAFSQELMNYVDFSNNDTASKGEAYFIVAFDGKRLNRAAMYSQERLTHPELLELIQVLDEFDKTEY